MARIAIGVPLHDEVVNLRSALASLLGQRFDEFGVVVLDDSASDEPGRIVRREFDDGRLHYARNPRRLGLVRTWRRAFELARELHPELTYFAWGSDHDLWEPEWLSVLSQELDDHGPAVLAYPFNDRLDAGGRIVRNPWQFDTAGIRSRSLRFGKTIRRMVAGDMVYGLMRVDALERCGVFRRVLLPDRLLLAELALQGEFRQVPRLLWHRRRSERFEPEPRRQRAAHGEAPPWGFLPWSLQHAGAILWNDGVRGLGRPVGRVAGLSAALCYLVLSPGFRIARRLRKAVAGNLAA